MDVLLLVSSSIDKFVIDKYLLWQVVLVELQSGGVTPLSLLSCEHVFGFFAEMVKYRSQSFGSSFTHGGY
jgi:hypothetical protein